MARSKKLIGVMLSILMVFALTPVMAFAASGTNNDDGTITIENATEGASYSVYQVLKLESYNSDANAYSYKAVDDWAHFLGSDQVIGKYMTQQNGYFSWIENASIADFAKLAVEYAKSKNIEPTQGPITAEGNLVEFKGLNLGYYLLDSSMGTLCSLDTAAPGVTIKEKNSAPENNKEVLENSNNEWGSENSANIGDTVSFRSTITVGKGASKYTLHDAMTDGLTWSKTVAVTLNGTAVDDSNYTLKSEGLSDGCTFEVAFTEDFCKGLTEGAQIVVSYDAVLNEDAAVGKAEGNDGNKNTSKLTYGDNSLATLDEVTTTYTSGFQLVKTDPNNVVLGVGDEVAEGDYATFKLFDSESGGSEIFLIEDQDDLGSYRVATSDEIAAEGFTPAIIKAGIASITGLKDGSYYLEEVSAPNGYNMITGRIPVTLSKEFKSADTIDTKNPGEWNAETKEYEGFDPGHIEYVSGGVKVENQTGSLLPSTGGIGTTIFYIIGSLLVVGGVVYIVSRKRRSSSKEE